MNSEIKDKAYHEELVREIEIKEARSLFLRSSFSIFAARDTISKNIIKTS